MEIISVRPEIKKLIGVFQRTTPVTLYDPDEPKIQVNHIMSEISSFYEKVRNAIDYSEEHLIRQNAIHRILKRRLLVSVSRKNIGKSLISELIRAKYLENNFVPESKISIIEDVIKKYILLIEIIGKKKGIQAKLRYSDWLIGIAACEIEEKLDLITRNNAMINSLFEIMQPQVCYMSDEGTEVECNLQLYIALHRSLIKSDHSIIAYHLLNLSYNQFRSADATLIEEIAENIDSLARKIKHDLENPLSFKLSKMLHHSTICFTFLRDVIEQDEHTALERLVSPGILDVNLRKSAAKRYQSTSEKLNRSIVNSVIYIFVTKIILAFILELPYDFFILKEFHPLPLTINVLFPPVLMFLIARSARVPSAKNTLAIMEGIKKIVSGSDDLPEYLLKGASHRSLVKQVFFSITYIVLYLITFGAIISALKGLDFNIVSIFLFILFLCVVSFLGIKIRRSVKELNVLHTKDGIITSLFEFFFLPVLEIGRWVSVKFSKINVFAFALDYILEAPLKSVIEIVEEWFSFMKEKKEDIY